MTRTETSVQLMGQNTSGVCHQFENQYQGNPVVTNNVGVLDAINAELADWAAKQMQALIILGYVQDKKFMRALITTDAMQMVEALRGLSAEMNDTTIAASVNFSASKLSAMSDNGFVMACDQVKIVGDAHAQALVPHGVTAQMLTTLGSDTASWAILAPKVKDAARKRHDATLQVGSTCTRLRAHLRKKLDKNMQQFKGSEFFRLYKLARRVVVRGASTGVKGTITDRATGRVLKNVRVEIMGTSTPMVKFTNKDGHYHFPVVELGKYTILCRAIGYPPTEFPDVQLEKDRLIDFNMVLEAVNVPAPQHA
jgi:carboxypeptidase family protein